jgi:hypothetical protein
MARHRPARRSRFEIFLVLSVVAIGSATWIGISVTHHQDDEKRAAESAKRAAVAQTNTIADPILALCAGGGDAARVLSTARTPDGQTVCGAAAGVKDNLPPPAPVGLSSAQVQTLINSALAKQQPAQPSTAQLSAAVQAFIAANPTMFKAPAPTNAQIQAAVAEYMRTHPVQIPQPLPTYQMPGLGGFSGAPGGVWQQPWPRGHTYPPR